MIIFGLIILMANASSSSVLEWLIVLRSKVSNRSTEPSSSLSSRAPNAPNRATGSPDGVSCKNVISLSLLSVRALERLYIFALSFVSHLHAHKNGKLTQLLETIDTTSPARIPYLVRSMFATMNASLRIPPYVTCLVVKVSSQMTFFGSVLHTFSSMNCVIERSGRRWTVKLEYTGAIDAGNGDCLFRE